MQVLTMLVPYLHARRFDLSSKRQKIQNGHKKFKKGPKNVNPLRGVILCDIVSRKNIKLGILIMSQKNLHKMTYHVQGFMAFGPNDRCYVLNHGIVCDAVPILCVNVDIRMENNVAQASFPFRRTKKAFFIFRAQKTDGFVATTKWLIQNAPPYFTKILDYLI